MPIGRARRSVSALAILALAQALGGWTAPPAPTAGAPPPSVLGWSPGVTRNVPLVGPFTVYFDRAMDRSSVQAAFRLSPPIPGSFRWSGTALSFRPRDLLKPGWYYRLTIGSSARDVRGMAMRQAFSVAFSTGDAPRVQSVTPPRAATGVPGNGLIAITFTHPMVALGGLSALTPNPPGWSLSIEPRTSGFGSWLGTSTWVFHPSGGLQPSTRYSVTLRGSARDAWGQPLGKDLRWSFRTTTPEVRGESPGNGAQFVNPKGTVKVSFNQPMNRSAAARAFSLSAEGRRVPGTIRWQGNALTFSPRSELSGDTTYVASVAPTASAANGRASLAKRVTWRFRVAPSPAVVSTTPDLGGTAYGWTPYQGAGPPGATFGVEIDFSAPMDKASLDRRLSISPRISQLATWLSGPNDASQFAYTVYGDFQASTRYTVSLGNGAQDRFGRALPGPYSLSFKMARLAPSVALYGMPGAADGIAFSAGRVYQAPIQFVNVPRVHYELIHTTLQALAQWNGGGASNQPDGTTVRKWSESVAHVLNRVENLTVGLAGKDGKPLAPGVYWLKASTDQNIPGWRPGWTAPPSSSEVIYVTNVGVTLKQEGRANLVWVTDAQSGGPLAGARVRLVDYQMSNLASARTDKNGLYLFRNVSPQSGVNAVVDGGGHFGLARQFWTPNTGSPFLGFLPWTGPAPNSNGTYVYTDRPIYRPGQRVRFRAVLWRDQDAVYSSLGARTAQVRAWDTWERRLYRARLTVDRFGAIQGAFNLRSSAATGVDSLSISVPQLVNAYTSFTVADYHKPEFLTSIKPAQSSYVQKQTLNARVRVTYVFGAPVVRQQVTWVAYAQPRTSPPPGWDGYSFFNWDEFWPQLSQQTSTQASQFGTIVAQGKGKTDAKGNLAIHMPVDLAHQPVDETVTVEATTTDASHRPVSGRVQVPAFRAAFAVGLQAAEQLVPAGRQDTVEVVAVKPDGTAVAGQALVARIFRRTYTSKLVSQNGTSSWQPVPHDALFATRDLTTDAKGKAILSFVPKEGGECYIAVSGTDALGNAARNSISIYASAEGFSDWGQSSNTAVTLKPDKGSYRVGDTAHILVAAPFDNASALVTEERGTIRSYRVQRLRTNSSTVNVPITLSDLPNVYVTVALYRGWRNGSPPDWRYGSVNLEVRLDPRHLIVHLKQTGYRHHPGDMVTYTVMTADARGRPVSGEVSLALVDTAVLALQNETNPDILKALYSERPLGVSTASEGVISVDHLQTQPDFVIRPLGPPRTALEAPIAAPAKTGGGGGCGGPACAPAVTVRAHFADTAYWRGALITGSSGRARIRVHLPDNATTWRLDARGVTAAQQVGQAQLKTLATQDVVVRPVLPRFLLEGDTLRIGAVVNNTLGRPAALSVSVTAAGLKISRAAGRRVTVPAHGERLITWAASVPQGGTARITFRAVSRSAGIRGDAVRLALPVHAPLTDETVATAGQVYGSVKQYVILPRNAMSQPGELSVQVSSSLTSGMGAAYAEFRPSSLESNEDVSDRVLAAASLRSLPSTLTGLSTRTYSSLPQVMAAGIQKLLDHQLGDGGWPWFNGPFAQSDPAITADVVQALGAAHVYVPGKAAAMARGRLYLHQQLDTVAPDERAHLLLVLAESGRAPKSASEALYDDSVRRYHLDVASLANLGSALRVGGDAAKARSVLSALDSRAVVSATGAHWESSVTDYFSESAVGTTITVLGTLLGLSPRDPFVPAAVRWLMFARQGSGWDCPPDSAQAIAVLARYARAAHEGRADYSYRVMVDGRLKLAGRYTAENQRYVAKASVPVGRLRRSAASSVVLDREANGGIFGPGPMYYVARLHYFLQAGGITARDEGLSVSRQYLNLRGRPIRSAAAGSVVKVKLTVRADQTLLYLDLDDPVPAGFEPIDQSLNTSQQGLFRPQYFPFGGAPNLSWFVVHSDLRDDRVSLYISYLPPGTYSYTYLAEASVAGRYSVAPSRASESFFPEVFGRSAGFTFTVT